MCVCLSFIPVDEILWLPIQVNLSSSRSDHVNVFIQYVCVCVEKKKQTVNELWIYFQRVYYQQQKNMEKRQKLELSEIDDAKRFNIHHIFLFLSLARNQISEIESINFR